LIAAGVLVLLHERRVAKFVLALAVAGLVITVPLTIVSEVRYHACRDTVKDNLAREGVGVGAGRAFLATYDGPYFVTCDGVHTRPWESY